MTRGRSWTSLLAISVGYKTGVDNLTSENATHLLSCAHAIGRSRKEYKMRCHILKTMDDGRIKILVFGERYWKDKEHISQIRYVSKWRITKRDGYNFPL